MVMKDGVLTKDELNLILLIDNSWSMNGKSINQVNQAIPVLRENLIEVAKAESVDLKIRIIVFSDEAIWEVGAVDHGEDINNVVWKTLDVVGETATAKAIREANKALKKQYLGDHALRPVVVLITDGNCTDEHSEYLSAIAEMKKCLGGSTGKEKVTRVAIGVQNFNRDELVEFASEGLIMDQMQPLIFSVDEPEKLSKIIDWVTVTSIYSSIIEGGGDDTVVEFDPDEWIEINK